MPVLYGSTLVLSRLTGWSFPVVLWGTVALVGLYTVKGGLASVMWTDAVQCVMLLGGGITLFFVALARIPGGWNAMVLANPERFHLYRPPDDPIAPFPALICGTLGVFLFYQASNQVMIQRVLAARSTWDGLMGIIFAGFINLFSPIVTCFLGFIVYHWIHDLHQAEPLDNADATFPFALTAFASLSGLRGVILAGFLAAVMSAVSAQANSTATIFALDIYKRMVRKRRRRQRSGASRPDRFDARPVHRRLCLSSRGEPGGHFYLLPDGGHLAGNAVHFGVPARDSLEAYKLSGRGLRDRRRTGHPARGRAGAPLLGFHLHWLYIAFIAQVIIMAGVVAVSLATLPPVYEQIEGFVWRPALLGSHAREIARPWYQSVGLWFGLYAAIWFFMYWRFW